MEERIRAFMKVLARRKVVIAGIVLVVLYFLFLANLTTHPAGSYVDESCEAYNGYLIAKTGTAENGTKFPLFFQCYTQGYTQWMSPLYIYFMAAMYVVVPPSVLSARVLSATLVFVTSILLGVLGFRISRRQSVGVIVFLLALTTPWLFEISRLALEACSLAFSAALLLTFVYRANTREKWGLLDCALIAISLAMITYAYAGGRMLAPLLGLGLLIFANSWRAFFDVVKTGVFYTITMVPFLIVLFTNQNAISGRFSVATNLDSKKTILENIGTVLTAFFTDMSLQFFIFEGDKHHRHHIPAGMGEFLVGTFALGILGVLIILFRSHWRRWWIFILYGCVITLLPGAITFERFHALRNIVFPVFFLTLTIPAIAWLLEIKKGNFGTPTSINGRESIFLPAKIAQTLRDENFLRRALLGSLLILTAIQAVMFYIKYLELGDDRDHEFNVGYPSIFQTAIADPRRPIYLEDGGDPAYIHAIWYGVIDGIDTSNFVHLLDGQSAPFGSLVISARDRCDRCRVIAKKGSFTLYESLKNGPEQSAAAPGRLASPHGLAVGPGGLRYVADTGNSRIQVFDPDGKYVKQFGVAGTYTGQIEQPHGIAVNKQGETYVTDSSRHKLIKFDPNGKFVKEWSGPDPGFYGPRDLEIAPDGKLYIVDQGRSRIVRFDPSNEEFVAWGAHGPEEGNFIQPTGISIGDGSVFVTDVLNDRVQVFDLNGGFIRQWPVTEWEKDHLAFPDVFYDQVSKQVFVTSGRTGQVLVYDATGTLIKSVEPGLPGQARPSSIALYAAEKERRLLILNVTGEPDIASVDISK